MLLRICDTHFTHTEYDNHKFNYEDYFEVVCFRLSQFIEIEGEAEQ